MDDLAVPQHHRSGAHRARRHPLLSALVVVGSVAVASALLLWALLTFDVLGVGDDLLEAGGETTPAAVEPTTGPSTAPSADPSAGPSAAPSVEPSVEPAPEPSLEPTVDRSLPVDVLNSTSTVGLAAGAAEALTADGWTVGEVGNYGQGEIPTVVLYPEGSQAVTAQAVATDLGAGQAQASDAVQVLTVVLGPDYSG